MILPPAFERVREGSLVMFLRRDLAQRLAPVFRAWAAGTFVAERVLPGGRGSAAVVDLGPDLSLVFRAYRRGGLVRRLTKETYFGLRPRSLSELIVTEEARSRGVPTVEILGAAGRWLFPGVYRASIASREEPNTENLWHYLRRVPPERRAAGCARAADAVRALHAAGIVHPDLNLQNFLVCDSGAGLDVRLIDFDRAVIRRVTDRDRRRAFARLCRSIRRLDPIAEVLTLACIEELHRVETNREGRPAAGSQEGPRS